MRRLFIVPDYYRKGTWYRYFIDRICKDFGFIWVFESDVALTADTEVVIAFAMPHFNWVDEIIPELLKLPKSVKLISWPTDLHCGDLTSFTVVRCKEEALGLFERADLILSPYYNRMMEEYSKFVGKYKYVPWTFVPQKAYLKYTLNEVPHLQCLQLGQCSPHIYPLRHRIMRAAGKDGAIRYSHGLKEARYVKWLHHHVCGIVDVGHNEALQPKYFEIPAVGSLLLGRKTNLVDDLGFVPYKHYVPFDGDDVFDKAHEIVANPEKFLEIRKAGMKFVREEHNFERRLEVLYPVLEKLIPRGVK